MKISNSKKELARIISENGGWRDVADWAAQDEVVAFFSGGKPKYATQDKVWCANGDDGYFISAIGADGKIKCFHNTILSREEYFHLYPAPDADGWIEWNGGECPVEKGTMIDVRYRFGKENIGVTALIFRGNDGFKSGLMHNGLSRAATHWMQDGSDMDIIAYRLHKPEQAKSTDVGDDENNLAAKEELESMEFCESVTRSIPEPETKPSIEQLAADYRNSKDYADRKQQEADDAKTDAEAKLAELVAAGEAIGLVVSVTKKQVYTGKFHSAKHGDKPSDLDMICDGCGKRFGTHVGFDCRP